MRIIRSLYWKLYKIFWKTYARYMPKQATKSWYKKNMGEYPDLANPKKLSEKLQLLKLTEYYKSPLVRQCADKYAVREYVKSCGCSEILNELYAVYDSASEIVWDDLPNQFVLKCNHGCGGNIVCYDKQKLDKNKAIENLNSWMKEEYGLEHVEYSYEGIPRKIICEKLIQTESGELPRDYKIFCSYGEPKLVYAISERKGDTENLDYFTMDWEWLPVRNGELPNAVSPMEKPEKLDEMFSYARKLSKDFPIVRVDLYCEFGSILFGELTFLPTGGCFKLDPPKFDLIFGDWFPLKNIDLKK